MADRPIRPRHLSLVPPLPQEQRDRPTFTHGRSEEAVLLRLNHPSRQHDDPKEYTCYLGREELAWNPTAPTVPIVGPATLTYRLYPSGTVTIDIRVES